MAVTQTDVLPQYVDQNGDTVMCYPVTRMVERVVLADGISLNSITEPGFSSATLQAKSDSITNKPSDAAGWSNGFALDVVQMRYVSAMDRTVQQMIHSLSGVWMRRATILSGTTTCTAWERILTSGSKNIINDILSISRAGTAMIEFESTLAGRETFGSIQASDGAIGIESKDVDTGNIRAIKVRSYKTHPSASQAFTIQQNVGGTMSTWYGHHTGELMVAVGSLNIAIPELAIGATYQAPIVTYGKVFPDATNLYVGIQCLTYDWVRTGILPWAMDMTTTGFKPSFKNATDTNTTATTYYGRFVAVWSL